MESINTNLTVPTQNKTDFTKSVRHGKGSRDLNLGRKIETSETTASSNAKIRDHQEKENRNRKSWRHIFITGDSIVKHITNPRISKNDQVQIKTHPGITTDNIIDYIKPTIRQKSEISLLSILERMT